MRNYYRNNSGYEDEETGVYIDTDIDVELINECPSYTSDDEKNK